MIKSSDISTDVILFNIDSKSSNSESEKDKILDVFVKVFNEMRGYCTEYPFLAEFEKKLDEKGKLEEFKSVFKEINGEEWDIVRDDYFFISDDIVDAIVTIGFMSEDAARNWADKADENYSMSIEKFAEEVEEIVPAEEAEDETLLAAAEDEDSDDGLDDIDDFDDEASNAQDDSLDAEEDSSPAKTTYMFLKITMND